MTNNRCRVCKLTKVPEVMTTTTLCKSCADWTDPCSNVRCEDGLVWITRRKGSYRGSSKQRRCGTCGGTGRMTAAGHRLPGT